MVVAFAGRGVWKGRVCCVEVGDGVVGGGSIVQV